MNDQLGHMLLWISTSLLVPDLLLLLAFCLYCAANVGGILGEAWTRARHRRPFADLVCSVRRTGHMNLPLKDVPATFGLPRLAFQELRLSHHARAKVLDDLQLRADRSLARLHLGVRLGPMLGLVGTLIPLGPALKALAAGDTQMLANSLVIAFSTPVVGMLIGGLCFTMHALRQRWYTQDLNDVEFLFDHWTPEPQSLNHRDTETQSKVLETRAI